MPLKTRRLPLKGTTSKRPNKLWIKVWNYFTRERQKLILLADKSQYGWKTVLEDKNHDLADDDEEEKKIYRAESQAATILAKNFGTLYQKS